MRDSAHKAVAVVGVGAVLPDAPDAPSFWRNIKNGGIALPTSGRTAGILRLLRPGPESPIRFDHQAHLKGAVRGIQLRCTSCHNHIVQRGHIAVTDQVCYTCHFKGAGKGEAVTGWEVCHGSPKKIVEHAGFSFNHQSYLNIGVACSQCHVQVVSGDAGVSRERCATCHVGREERLKDVQFLHENHIAKHKVDSRECHAPIRHGKIQLVEPLEVRCERCHIHQHSLRKLMYIGEKVGAEGFSIDGLNAWTVNRRSGLPVRDVLQTWGAAADSLLASCSGLTDDEWASNRYAWIAGDIAARYLLQSRIVEWFLHGEDMRATNGVSTRWQLAWQHWPVHLTIDMAVRMLPWALGRAGRDLAGLSVQIEVSGAGEGTWHWGLGPGDVPSVASRQPTTPPALDRLVGRCLSKDPADRWQSAARTAPFHNGHR